MQGSSKKKSDYSYGNEAGIQVYVDKMGNSNPVSNLIPHSVWNEWHWYVNPVMHMDPPLFYSPLPSNFPTPSVSPITRGNSRLWELFYWRYRYLIDLNAQEPKPDAEPVAQ